MLLVLMAMYKKHRYLRNRNFPVKFILDTDREESEIFTKLAYLTGRR